MRIIRADGLVVDSGDKSRYTKPPWDWEDFCPECGDFLGYEGRECPCMDEGQDDIDGEYLDDYYEGEQFGRFIDPAELGRIMEIMFDQEAEGNTPQGARAK